MDKKKKKYKKRGKPNKEEKEKRGGEREDHRNRGSVTGGGRSYKSTKEELHSQTCHCG